MLLPLTAEVVDMVAAVVDMAVAGSTAVAAGDFVPAGAAVHSSPVGIAALRSLQVDNAPLHSLQVDNAPLHSSQVDNAPLHSSQVRIAARHSSRVNVAHGHSSQVGIAAISGTAVGGITALARAGYGRTITASTCGPAIKGDRRVGISQFSCPSCPTASFPAGPAAGRPLCSTAAWVSARVSAPLDPQLLSRSR
jgi:hypothetical protein